MFYQNVQIKRRNMAVRSRLTSKTSVSGRFDVQDVRSVDILDVADMSTTDCEFDYTSDVMLRFVADSPEALILLSRAAEPPVRPGELAELRMLKRSVLLESSVVDFMVTWEEVRVPDQEFVCT